MAARSRTGKAKTAFLTTQEEPTSDEIVKVRNFLKQSADRLYGDAPQLSAKEVKTIAEQSVINLHKRPPGHR